MLTRLCCVVQFPDLNRALRPNPVTNLQQGWRILDFNSHHPESILQFMWLLGDRGIPKSWRFMEGFGIHTFVLAARDGKQTYVKFKWEPKAGARPTLCWALLAFQCICDITILSAAHCPMADTAEQHQPKICCVKCMHVQWVAQV